MFTDSALNRVKIMSNVKDFVKKLYCMSKSGCRAVFITGCPRSGTTLAKRYLGTHPSIHIAPYIGLYYPNKLQTFGAFKELSFSEITVFKQNSWVVDNDKWSPDKTAIPFLKKMFPKCHFVLVVRNPSATLASLKETDRHPEVPKDESFPLWWVDLYKNALKDLEGTSNLIVRYEDLVKKPYDVKKEFCNMLDIRYDPEMHDVRYDAAAKNDPHSDVFEDHKCKAQDTINEGSLYRSDSTMLVPPALKSFAKQFDYYL